MKAILYVSRSVMHGPHAEQDVRRLAEAARERNRALRVTGALIFTGDHFAQYLEGPAAAVDAVMASIMRDARHRSIASFEQEVAWRRFADWDLAFSGQSSFVDRQVRALFTRPDRLDLKQAREELIELLTVFATS